ncbi:coproporphyrinogen III oxidase [Pedobacter sp. JCM 36344]|uniref:coproporphyrinogen III oxidase n=1 Tax=Pedobacter sp. JCM 36344 TaxID=3374280 RepID=UPI003979B32E
MKKFILSLAFAASIMIAVSACSSTKSISEGADSTMTDTTGTPLDSTIMQVDTTIISVDTTMVKPM